MSVGHLVHVLLTVYNATEHVTQKSGPMCGWVGRILRPYSYMSGSSWSKMPLWSIWFVAVPPWRPLPHCPSQWHGCLPRHGQWWRTCELYYSPSSGGLGLCTGWCTERRHTSDQYLNFSSHHPLNHKLAVIRTLLERCYSKELEEDDQKKEEHVQRCSISMATLPGPLTRSNGISCRNHGRAKHRKDRIKEANTKVWLFCHM